MRRHARTSSTQPAVRTVVAVTALGAALALGACSADAPAPASTRVAAAVAPSTSAGATVQPAPSSTAVATPAPTSSSTGAATAAPSTTPARPTSAPPPNRPTPRPTPSSSPTTAPVSLPPSPVLLRRGDTGPRVRALQARLRQIGWYAGDVSDRYGSRTETAVRGFQSRRGYEPTGRLDERTWDRLVAMTHRPTSDELANARPKPAEGAAPGAQAASWDVDPRCLVGRVMCISKTTRHLTWVVDGVPQYGFDVRFGSEQHPTREGVFSVYKKKVDVISNLYHTPMPYSLFFSGGEAVHYSSNFARLGYTSTSHGCVNVRDHAGIVRLYGDARVGDTVVVHR